MDDTRNLIALIALVFGGLSFVIGCIFVPVIQHVFRRINGHDHDITKIRERCAGSSHISEKDIQKKIDKSIDTFQKLVCQKLDGIVDSIKDLKKSEDKSKKARILYAQSFQVLMKKNNEEVLADGFAKLLDKE